MAKRVEMSIGMIATIEPGWDLVSQDQQEAMIWEYVKTVQRLHGIIIEGVKIVPLKEFLDAADKKSTYKELGVVKGSRMMRMLEEQYKKNSALLVIYPEKFLKIEKVVN